MNPVQTGILDFRRQTRVYSLLIDLRQEYPWLLEAADILPQGFGRQQLDASGSKPLVGCSFVDPELVGVLLRWVYEKVAKA